jgi:hypothetical protein
MADLLFEPSESSGAKSPCVEARYVDPELRGDAPRIGKSESVSYSGSRGIDSPAGILLRFRRTATVQSTTRGDGQ